jgi:hypothetical protein
LAHIDQEGQVLTLESKEVESDSHASITKMTIDPNFAPAAQALSSAVKLAAFKIRTQRYFQVLLRMFSM